MLYPVTIKHILKHTTTLPLLFVPFTSREALSHAAPRAVLAIFKGEWHWKANALMGPRRWVHCQQQQQSLRPNIPAAASAGPGLLNNLSQAIFSPPPSAKQKHPDRRSTLLQYRHLIIIIIIITCRYFSYILSPVSPSWCGVEHFWFVVANTRSATIVTILSLCLPRVVSRHRQVL